MKLAIINQTSSTGGWRYIYLLIKNIIKYRPNYNITIFIDKFDNIEDIEKIKKLNVELKKIYTKTSHQYKYKSKFKLKKINKLYNNIRKIIYKIKKSKTNITSILNSNILDTYDIVFFAWPYGIEAPNIKKPIFFIPHDFIFTHFFGLHTFNVYSHEFWTGHYTLMKTFIDKKAHAIVSSNYIADEFKKTFPDYEKKVEVIHLSSFNDYYHFSKHEINLVLKKYDIEHQYILYANNWTLHKNMQVIIGAYYYVKQLYPDIKIIITGHNTEGIRCKCNSPLYWDHVKEEEDYDIKSLGLIPEKDFLAIMQGSKMVVNSSLSEAGSGSALDAWKMGVPTVLSDIPPFREQTDFLGTKSEFFDPRNSKDAALAIIRILNNPEKVYIDALASSKAIKKYTWKDVANLYIQLFENSQVRGN